MAAGAHWKIWRSLCAPVGAVTTTLVATTCITLCTACLRDAM